MRIGTVETINDIDNRYNVFFDGDKNSAYDITITKENADKVVELIKEEFSYEYRGYCDDYKTIEKGDYIWDDDDTSWYINNIFHIPKFKEKPTKNQVIASMFYSDVWESVVSI